ncbi:proteasome assembly chaperone 1 [Aphomia sociella]
MTTFGEIVEPSSRTAWEDWDEITSENEFLELQWQGDVGTLKEIETFIILEGKYLSDIVSAQTQHKLEFVNSIKEANLNLFTANNKYICIIKDYELVQSSDIIELLKPYISVSQHVITIQTKALAEFQSSEYFNHDCLVRTIHTTKPSRFHNPNFPKLEQPNIISGISAGVISLREHLGQSGAAVVCYIEYPEDYHIEAIQILLKQLDIIQSGNAKTSSILNSNLYI